MICTFRKFYKKKISTQQGHLKLYYNRSRDYKTKIKGEIDMPPVIDENRCIRCQKCASICCMDVFGPVRVKEIPYPIYAEECWHCRACVIECPVQAIQMRYPLPLMMLYKDAIAMEGVE